MKKGLILWEEDKSINERSDKSISKKNLYRWTNQHRKLMQMNQLAQNVYADEPVSTECLCKLVKIALKENYFELGDEIFH